MLAVLTNFGPVWRSINSRVRAVANEGRAPARMLLLSHGRLEFPEMRRYSAKPLTAAALAFVAILMAEPAAAFRCGTKLVKDGMHEQQVLAICGEPTTVRHLGYTIRAIDIGFRRRLSRGFGERRYPGYGFINQEVVVTEFVYNFGPRKLMRRLVFEGGILVTIETIGYGYLEKSP